MYGMAENFSKAVKTKKNFQGDVLLAADQKGNTVQVVGVNSTTGLLMTTSPIITSPTLPQPALVTFFTW